MLTVLVGYDLAADGGVKTMLEEFDQVVGLSYLKAMHLNDSKGAAWNLNIKKIRLASLFTPLKNLSKLVFWLLLEIIRRCLLQVNWAATSIVMRTSVKVTLESLHFRTSSMSPDWTTSL